jgi:O-antigen/teichoic acid export membrane protein
VSETPDAPVEGTKSLTRGGLLARNVALNVAGTVIPALLALVAVPILVRAFGDARFGILALAWTALGYFSLFDLGIARAVTHAVADSLGDGRRHEVGTVIWTSLALLLPVGIIAGGVLYLVAPAISSMLNLPPDVHDEATASFRFLAFAVPFASASGALRGALEGQQSFGLVNALRVPLGLLTFLAPLVSLQFSRSLVPAIAILAIGRAVLCIAHVVAVAKAVPAFRSETAKWSGLIARRLLAMGGWMQVTHLVSPLMATLDRFVVGAVLGVGLVTYYVAPQELVTKMWLFNIAVLPVFFSAVSTTGTRDPERTTALFDKLLRLTLALIFLPTFLIVSLAPDILRLWLGQAFAEQSTVVMQVLAIAVFVNCLGQVALSLIQALGRADLSAKYHLAELPIYAAMLWFLLPRYGIIGAAIAWSARTIGDTIVLLATCPVLLRRTGATVGRLAAWLTATTAILVAAAFLSESSTRYAVAVVAIPMWLALSWRVLLTREERALPLQAFSAAWRTGQA